MRPSWIRSADLVGGPLRPPAWIPLLIVLLLGLGGCRAGHPMMRTPTIVTYPERNFVDQTPPDRRVADIAVIYATDRAPVAKKDGVVRYGRERSRTLTVGECMVKVGKATTWQEVRDTSLARRRGASSRMRVASWFPRFQYPPTPWQLDEDPSRVRYETERDRARADLHRLLQRRLADGDRHEVLVYIHGVRNDLDDAACVAAEFWHFLGRPGVAVVYSWPAGQHNLIRGYTADSESGEFTLHHLKQFLEDVASSPDVERVQVIAHSRGTDVLMTALRELHIEYTARGQVTREALKLDHVILASPDIDVEVGDQRLAAENIDEAFGHMTVYLNDADQALLLSRWLHNSVGRLGGIDLTEMKERSAFMTDRYRNVTLIQADVRSDWLGHNYFYGNPAVSSDLLLALRESGKPEFSPARRLRNLGPNMWLLED